MNNIYKIRLLGLVLMLLVGIGLRSQVNIGLLEPAEKAGLLQIKEKEPSLPFVDNQTALTGGLNLPRVELRKIDNLYPLLSDEETGAEDYPTQKQLHVGAVVYNTKKDPTNSLFPGIFVWNGETWMLQKSIALNNFDLLVNTTSLTFPSGLTAEAIGTQPLSIRWLPLAATCFTGIDPILNGGVNYTPPQILPSNPQTLNVTLGAMLPTEIASDPFREKASTLNITLIEGGSMETKKITIRQIYYSIQVVNRWDVGSTGTNEAELAKEYTVKIRSNADWKVEIDKPALFADLGVYPQMGTANIVEGTEYKFRIIESNANEGQTAKLTFKSLVAGRCNDVVINLATTREYPNTYIVEPGSIFSFPVKKAYTAWEQDSDLSKTPLPSGTLGAVLIWQDEPNLIKQSPGVTISGIGRDATIRVETTTGMEGNALIALTINGTIYWNWQLWITSYNPAEALEHKFSETQSENIDVKNSGNALVGKVYSYFNTKKNTVIMDRNLGATTVTLDLPTSSGLMYQNGRKDPFPPMANPLDYPGFNAPLETKPLYTLANSRYTGIRTVRTLDIIKNYFRDIFLEPTLFLHANTNDNDWYSSIIGEHRFNFWLLENGQKGLFDPCPKGWRVFSAGSGTSSPVYGLPARATPVGHVYGVDYADLNFGVFPGTGSCMGPTGITATFYGGMSPTLWSSTGQGAYALSINKVNTGASQRHFGAPVRCVRDESLNH